MFDINCSRHFVLLPFPIIVLSDKRDVLEIIAKLELIMNTNLYGDSKEQPVMAMWKIWNCQTLHIVTGDH